MVKDLRKRMEKIQIIFEVSGGFSDEEILELLNDIRIVIEQRPKTSGLTIIRL